MKIKHYCRSSFLILFVIIFSMSMYSQEKSDEGSVRIPWEEFRKLLELDKDEVILSWEEFQKILNQTGQKYVPLFQLKNEKVILTRDQFKKLLDRMKPPVITLIRPPADYLITKASYKGKITKTNALFRADFGVEIFAKQRSQYVKIPLFPQNIALKDVLFDGKQGLVLLEGNRHTLATKNVGKHQIAVDLSLKTTGDQGPQGLSFPIPRTSITSLEIDIPYTKIEVEISNAHQIEISERGRMTHVSALLSPSNSINIKWRRKLPEAVKGPAKIYADTVSHISIEDDALRVNANITLSVLQNTIPSITLKVPEGYSILNVRGSGLGDWRELTRNETAFLEIPFDYPKKGNFPITITAEKLLSESSLAVDFTGFSVEDAIREKGFLGVELKSTSEAALSSSEGLDKLDVSELPAVLINRSIKPLLFGFKYMRHPYSLVLDIKKHEELPMISTVVDSASGVTLFTEDGKLIHRIIYKIRNTSKQFLELELPKDAQIWSVFVAGEPTKPRLNKSKILIPLNRSRQGASGLTAFDVELIYYEKSKRFGWYGQRASFFPVPDIIISQMLWSVYLPVGYTFPYFGGSVEKEKMASGIRPLFASKRRANYKIKGAEIPAEKDDKYFNKQLRDADEVKKQFSPNLALREEQIVEQMENEAQFSQRVRAVQEGKVQVTSGVLPIRIQIPTTGQVFRFAKTIVSEEPLTLSFSYASGSTMMLILLAILAVFLLILFFIRKKIKKLIGFFQNSYQVRHTPILLLVLSLVLLPISKVFSILCFVGFIVMLALFWFKKIWDSKETEDKS